MLVTHVILKWVNSLFSCLIIVRCGVKLSCLYLLSLCSFFLSTFTSRAIISDPLCEPLLWYLLAITPHNNRVALFCDNHSSPLLSLRFYWCCLCHEGTSRNITVLSCYVTWYYLSCILCVIVKQPQSYWIILKPNCSYTLKPHCCVSYKLYVSEQSP